MLTHDVQAYLAVRRASSVSVSPTMVASPLKLLQITIRNSQGSHYTCGSDDSAHDLTKVGRLRYLPFSTASIITSNDNTAP
jgi:hypothetical protein